MMFKDPLQTDETPYEILGLAPDASAGRGAGVTRALSARREESASPGARAAGVAETEHDGQRAGVDPMLYSADAVAEAPAVPSYPANELYSDVTGLDWHQEARASLPADLKRYDDLGQIDWTPEFRPLIGEIQPGEENLVTAARAQVAFERQVKGHFHFSHRRT